MKNISSLEKGRSMVEMLAVLSVIGFLSVGSVMIYEMAMDKYRAYTTQNELSLWAMMYAQERTNTSMEQTQELTTKMGYKLSLTPSWQPHRFKMVLQKVPSSVCENLIALGWKEPYKIIIENPSPSRQGNECGGTDTQKSIIYYFNPYNDK